ncbi:MAG: pantetheine-phosphate adenylyltransferase [Bacteroidetes bacterium]|nr:pantetheine-phosphate adenylyltransferase [Bacteroidota bacterium]
MTENKIAVFAGTFDPITLGHVDIINRSLPLFDKIIVAIGVNTKKQTLFELEDRENWIREIFKKEPKVEVASYSDLTVAFCKERSARYILRGLRNGSDFDYEAHIAQLNRELDAGIETIFCITSPELAYISSTIVRDLIIYGGNFKPFVPEAVNVDSVKRNF